MSDISWSSVVDKLIDHLNLFIVLLFLLLGTGLILLSANKGYTQLHISIFDPTWLVILPLLGGAFIIIATVTMFRSGRPLESLSKMQKKYGIEIQSPLVNSTVSSPIQVNGTCKKCNSDFELYAFEYNPAMQQYWPKGRLSIDYAEKKWTATMRIGNGNNQLRTLVIAYLGEDSLRLVEYYEKVKQETSPQRHIGIKKFPADFYELKKLSIILQATQ